MKKFICLSIVAIALSLVGCVDRYTIDYRCENGILYYDFKQTDAASGYVYVNSSGIATYRNTQQPIKCVK